MKKFSITFLNEPARSPLILEADRVEEKDGRYSFYKRPISDQHDAGEDRPDELVAAFVNINFSEYVPPVETEGKAAEAGETEA